MQRRGSSAVIWGRRHYSIRNLGLAQSSDRHFHSLTATDFSLSFKGVGEEKARVADYDQAVRRQSLDYDSIRTMAFYRVFQERTSFRINANLVLLLLVADYE